MIKQIYIVVISFLITFNLISFCNTNYAADSNDYSSVATIKLGKVLDPSSYKPGDMKNADEVKKVGNKIIGYIQLIGSIVSVVALAIIGIKYMTGSVEAKAEYKKTMFPYVIGAVLLFAISTFLGIINEIASNI